MDNFVDKALKMPHSVQLGYYLINDDERLLVSFYDDGTRYFNSTQKELLENNLSKLNADNFVELPRAVVNESEFYLGDTKLTGSVLNDNRRVIKDTSLFKVLDRSRKGEVRVPGYPPIIGSRKLAELLLETNPDNLNKVMPFEVAQSIKRCYRSVV